MIKKLLQNTAWNVSSLLLLIIFFGGLFLILKPSNQQINSEIKNLRQQNKVLLKKNDSVQSEILLYQKLKKETDQKIATLEAKEIERELRIKNLNYKLWKLNSEYEKARNRAAGYNSDDIRRYFSDSLER